MSDGSENLRFRLILCLLISHSIQSTSTTHSVILNKPSPNESSGWVAFARGCVFESRLRWPGIRSGARRANQSAYTVTLRHIGEPRTTESDIYTNPSVTNQYLTARPFYIVGCAKGQNVPLLGSCVREQRLFVRVNNGQLRFLWRKSKAPHRHIISPFLCLN